MGKINPISFINWRELLLPCEVKLSWANSSKSISEKKKKYKGIANFQFQWIDHKPSQHIIRAFRFQSLWALE
jgi:hypothetical protein